VLTQYFFYCKYNTFFQADRSYTHVNSHTRVLCMHSKPTDITWICICTQCTCRRKSCTLARRYFTLRPTNFSSASVILPCKICIPIDSHCLACGLVAYFRKDGVGKSLFPISLITFSTRVVDGTSALERENAVIYFTRSGIVGKCGCVINGSEDLQCSPFFRKHGFYMYSYRFFFSFLICLVTILAHL